MCCGNTRVRRGLSGSPAAGVVRRGVADGLIKIAIFRSTRNRGEVAPLRAGPASSCRIARDHSINHAVKQWPWQRLSAIGFEDLNGLKKGKSATRGKNFGKAAPPSTYRRVRQRIECLAAENRVLPIAVDREAPPEHVPLAARTIGATARERCLAVSPAITQAMPISSALETS
jgi:hypothetical protein